MHQIVSHHHYHHHQQHSIIVNINFFSQIKSFRSQLSIKNPLNSVHICCRLFFGIFFLYFIFFLLFFVMKISTKYVLLDWAIKLWNKQVFKKKKICYLPIGPIKNLFRKSSNFQSNFWHDLFTFNIFELEG